MIVTKTPYILRFIRSEDDRPVDRRDSVNAALRVLGSAVEVVEVTPAALTVLCDDAHLVEMRESVAGLAHVDDYEALKPLGKSFGL